MEENIRKILYGVEPRLEKYKGNNMIEDGILESIQLFELITLIEDELDIEISPEYIVPENFANIDTIILMINKLIDIA